MEFVMSGHRYIAAVATFITLVVWAFPGLACMEDPMHFEEIPMAPIECDSDLADLGMPGATPRQLCSAARRAPGSRT